MPRGRVRDSAQLWRPAVDGVELLHAYFQSHRYDRHAHESTTVGLVDTGAISFTYRGESFVVPAGGAFVINAGAVHTGRSLTEQGYRYRVLYLDQPALQPLLAADPELAEPVSYDETVSRGRRIASVLDRAHRVLAGTDPLRQQQTLVEVSRALRGQFGGRAVADDSEHGPERRRQAANMVRDYLDAHATDRVLLQDLATLTGVSAYRLVRIFSEVVGMPPHAYQNQVRIWRARRLLAAGIPAAQVATLVGFCDQPHLIRMFKKYTGVTPAQFVTEPLSCQHPGRAANGRPVR